MVDINEKRILHCQSSSLENEADGLEKALESKLEKKIQKKSHDYQENIWPCISCEKVTLLSAPVSRSSRVSCSS